MTDAFNAGYAACAEETDITANPFTWESVAWAEWNDGFMDAMADFGDD